VVAAAEVVTVGLDLDDDAVTAGVPAGVLAGAPAEELLLGGGDVMSTNVSLNRTKTMKMVWGKVLQ
jgi:hypothetical protein